jgi:hypothetical protein
MQIFRRSTNGGTSSGKRRLSAERKVSRRRGELGLSKKTGESCLAQRLAEFGVKRGHVALFCRSFDWYGNAVVVVPSRNFAIGCAPSQDVVYVALGDILRNCCPPRPMTTRHRTESNQLVYSNLRTVQLFFPWWVKSLAASFSRDYIRRNAFWTAFWYWSEKDKKCDI